MANINGNEFSNVLFGGLLNDNIQGFSGDDLLAGGEGNDILDGGSGNDVLSGDSGNDELRGGAGADVMVGGSGDDIYFVDNVGDVVIETSELGGTDSVISSVSHRLNDHFEILVLSGNGNINAFGNSLNNGLLGNNGNNQMFGLAGDDLFLGSAGDDLMDGGDGFDVVSYADFEQGIVLSAMGRINKGSLGVDMVRDVEEIIGAEGQFNLIDASSLPNSPVSINLDLSQDQLIVNGIPQVGRQSFTVRNFVDAVGTSQGDRMVGNSFDNTLIGEGGDDFIDGGSGSDYLEGGFGNDELRGGSGNDGIYGRQGNDFLIGGTGNDFLSGYGFGAGNEIDVLIGGSGFDTFQLGTSGNSFYLEPLVNNLDSSYAIIEDWDPTSDFVQLSSAFNYGLDFRVGNGIGSSAVDTLIFNRNDGNIVAFLQDTTDFNFARDAIFV